MAVRVGELYARLTLNDAEFKKKLDEAEKQMGKVAKASTVAFTAIAGSITAAAVAASNYAGEAQALANQTGLATEAVQGLGFAARRSDADLALLGTGMRSLVRRAAEAAQGHQGFAASFDEIGISAERLNELLRDPEQLLMEVADGLARLPTEAQASAAAMNVMSDSGRRLVPFLRQGSGAIRDLMNDAERMGLVMSGRAIADLANFGDEWATVRERIAAVSRTLAVEFLPTIRSALDAVDGAIDRVQNMSEDTRRLVGTIGSGTVGAVGAFAAMATAVWAATRAVNALGTAFKLASGPGGWIALAATGILSIVSGLKMAEMHAKATRQAIIDLGDTEAVTKELERVRKEMEQLEKAASPDFTTPVKGGPQMRFFAEGQFDKELEALREQERALTNRLAEIAEEERERERLLDSLEAVTVDAVESESETFRSWQKKIEGARRELELFAERLYITEELMGAGVDQAQFRKAVEQEAVQLLQRELELQRSIVEATESALGAAGLLPEEAEELAFQLEMAEAAVGRLEKELRQAGENLRLADYTTPFEQLDHLANLFRLQLETGVRPAEEIAERINEILAGMDDLNDGTVTYLRTLRDWKALAEQVEAALPQPLTPVAPGAPPRPTPTIHRDEARVQELADAFGLLELRVDASVVPMGDAIAKLHEMRSEIIRMAEAGGGLANANEEQLRLYNQLTSALERWMESLKELPSRLDEIRADMERSLGVGMAVERELARATGGEFDPLAYEMDVLRQTIQAMAVETAEITPEMEGYLRQLRELAAESRHLADINRLAGAAIQSLTRNMGALGRVLDGAISFKAGAGFSLDPTAMAINAISMVADALFSASDGSERTAQLMERAANAIERASRGWQETLSSGQFHELLEANPLEEMAELEKRIRSNQSQVKALHDRWIQFWNASSRMEQVGKLEAQIKEMRDLLEELETGWETDVKLRLSEVLGVDTRSLQSAVSSAFGASTAEDFSKNIEASLTGKVRNAFVTAFLESATMAPLFESLGDQIREALLDVDISPDEMEGIRAIMDDIKTRSAPLYDLLDEMGLLADTTDRVNREFARLVNVPMGVRALQTLRFQSATPQVLPAMAGAQGAGGSITNIGQVVLPNVSNFEQFERDVKRYESREGLRRAGNPTALRRLR